MNRLSSRIGLLAISGLFWQCTSSGMNPTTGGSGGTTSTGGHPSTGGSAGGVATGGTGTGGTGTGGTGTGGTGTGGVSTGGTGDGGSGTGGTGTGGSGGVTATGGTTTGGHAGSSATGGANGGAPGTGGGTGGAAGQPGIQPDGSFVTTCPNLFQSNTAGLPAVTPTPSPEQASYQHTELTAFIHFSLATFDGTEQGNTADKATVFAPTNLTQDTVNGWVTALKGAGFRQAMLTAKHSIGFCLWPSKSTNNCNQYSVAQSSWMNGGGDVVKMWTDAMHANGMRVAMYLAPWDQHFPSSKTGYQDYLENQMTELLTNYGPVYEIEFDGFNSPGSNGTPATVDWSHVFKLARQLQPHVLVWAGPEVAHMGAAASPPNFPDLQWIGNENGVASRTTSSLNLSNCATLANGTLVGTNLWCAWETNVSDRLTSGDHWFWHPQDTPMQLSNMQSIYFTSVGMNSTLIFNVPPSNTGAFDSKDVTLLQQFGSWSSTLYQTNLLKGQPTTTDSIWATTGFEGGKAVDDSVCTYWAAASGKTKGRLEVDPPSPVTFSVISIREPIELGERATSYHVEIKQNGAWNTAPKDKSGNTIKGTVIGQRQLWQLNQTTAEAIAVVVDTARGVPAIAEFGAY
jgi:alpha-L-fucosidase